jgi:hypothetical protein
MHDNLPVDELDFDVIIKVGVETFAPGAFLRESRL